MMVKKLKNKFLISFVFLTVAMSMQAQHLTEEPKEMTEKQYKKAIPELESSIADIQKDSLACEKKKMHLDSMIAKVSQRTFRLANPQEIERKYLSRYENLNRLIKESANVRKFLKWLPKKSDHADAYLKVLDMAASLDTIYDANKNEGYCNDIDNMKNMLYQKLEGFDALASNVKDYNFVMFELSRVFDIVDKKNYSYSTLLRNGETKFIDNIPYAKKQLQDYIDVSEQRKAIRVKLKEACPEAF